LLGSDLAFRKNLIRAMMEKQLILPATVWRTLNLSWAGFFLLTLLAERHLKRAAR